ncbi:hypothetical protein TWF694_003410 [Orbilia ellipsospora]|uniref:Manganese/iron superoxide dismutase C-terminal domain-containing protein n=1 Tax=Orbilia ellipsospora TaxID=2528407 RepID=A0AAV9WYZ5_9PEZI
MPPPRLRPSRLLSGCSNFLASSRMGTQRFAHPLIITKPSAPSQSRCLFTVPSLNRQDLYLENGIGSLYSANQVQIAWKEYQTYLTDRLNLLTAGTELQYHHALQIAIMTSRNSDQAAVFNYASMLHNNHFFFQSLSPAPVPVIPHLLAQIEESFGHMDILKETMLATAMACFSNAFVWLVIDNANKKMRILTTYNSGTPYGLAHRRQSVDTNTTSPLPPTPPPTDAISISQALSPTNDYQNSADQYNKAQTEQALTDVPSEIGRSSIFSPLLCVNVWEHAWLVDYGFDKKEEYLENWWNSVDWGVVWSRLEPLGFHNEKYRRAYMASEVRENEGGSVSGEPKLADHMNRRSMSR